MIVEMIPKEEKWDAIRRVWALSGRVPTDDPEPIMFYDCELVDTGSMVKICKGNNQYLYNPTGFWRIKVIRG